MESHKAAEQASDRWAEYRKPTGGTWVVCTEAPNELWRGDGTEVYSEYGRIAETYVSGLRIPEECQANARLIAAAPELLEALGYVLATLKAQFPKAQYEAMEVVQLADRALEKARG